MTKKDHVAFAEEPQVIPDVEDDVSSSTSSSDGEVEQSTPRQGATKYSKNEKKARKTLIKLGLKPVPGITRVTLVRSKMVFAIKAPEVFKNPLNNSYIVFGEAKVEDNGLMAQAQAAQRLKEQEGLMQQTTSPSDILQEEPVKPKQSYEEDDDSSPLDESGLDQKDIQMVMDQCRVSRRRAVRALRDNDNDIVNTIMELTG